MDGGAKEVIRSYTASFVDSRVARSELSMTDNRLGNGDIRFTRVEYLNPDGSECAVIRSGDHIVLRFHYYAEQPIRDPSFGLRLYTEMGTLITDTSPWLHGVHIPEVRPGHGHIDLEFESLNLVPGHYAISLWIVAVGGTPIFDGDVRASLEIEVADVYGSGRVLDHRYGLVYFPQRWGTPTNS
jgi:hypothetical protein